MRDLPFPSNRSRAATAPMPTLERVRVELGNGAATTAWVARFERAAFDLRVELIEPCATVLSWCGDGAAEHAIVGGFYMRPGGPPLGHLRIDGATAT